MTSKRIKPIYIKFIALGLLLFLIVLSFQAERLLSPIQKVPTTYQTVIDKNDPDIKYPFFRSRTLDKKVNAIINGLRANNEYINHETFFIGQDFVNIFFSTSSVGEDKNYFSVLLSTRTGEEHNITSILKKDTEDIFYQKIEEILNEKYPKFIVDALSDDSLNENGHLAFQIRSTNMRIYFSDFVIYPNPQHKIYIDINNHELKNILNYDFKLDIDETNPQTLPRENLKYVALTFDDGPKRGISDEIFQLLRQNKMSGTFFWLGSRIERNPDLVLRAINYGFEIGNHTYSHRNLIRSNRATIGHEMHRTDEVFRNITGKELSLFRPPFGHMNEYIRANFRYAYILWSLDPRDWENRDARFIADYILENIEPGDIILLHDLYITTLEAVRIILPELYVRGFQTVTVSELASINNRTLEPHTIYRSFKK